MGGQPALLHFQVHDPSANANAYDSNTTEATTAQHSSGGSQGTYWSSPEQYLRRLPAPHALEELVDDVLGHLDLHGLDGHVFGVPRLDVAIRSAVEGNAARGRQGGSHGVLLQLVCLHKSRSSFSRSLAPSWPSRETKHMESTQALCK